MSRTFSLLLFGFSALISACDGDNDIIDSPAVPSSNTYASINVSSDNGENVYITTQLKEGGNNSDTYIDLQGGDRLIASIGERLDTIHINDDLFSNLDYYSTRQRLMDRQSSGSEFELLFLKYVDIWRVWYSTTFGSIGADDKVYVSFIRSNSHTSAPDSFVTLPASFSITSPATGGDSLYSRATDGIDVTWSPMDSGAMVNISIKSNCTNDDSTLYNANLTDTGSHLVPANSITNLAGACTFTIRVEKYISGNLDSRFGGGAIWGRQIRSVNVATTD